MSVRMRMRLSYLTRLLGLNCSLEDLSGVFGLEFTQMIQSKLSGLYPEQARLLQRFYIEGDQMTSYDYIRLVEARRSLISWFTPSELQELENSRKVE